MEEIQVTIDGINAHFDGVGKLNELRKAYPERFSYSHGILMFDSYRVILPILNSTIA